MPDSDRIPQYTLLRRSRWLVLGLGLVPAILAVAAYLTSSRHLRSVQFTLQTTQFLRDLDDLLSTLKDAETGQRGFVLTGNPQYLEPYTTARARFPEQSERVVSEARREGVSDADIKSITDLAASKWQELDLTIQLRSQKGFSAALREVNTDRGEAYMSELRALIARIREARERPLQSAITLQQHRQVLLNATLAAGVAGSFALLLLAYRLSVGYERERDDMELAIRRLVRQRTAALESRTHDLELRTVELQRSNADLTQFAYAASHDLQEPLRTISSYVDLLGRRYASQLDETAQKYIEFAISGASRMQGLIADLLRYSRVGTQPPELSPTPMQHVLDTALENLGAVIAETGALVSAEPLPVVNGDAQQLTQVLQNLIGNAVKFRKVDIPPDISLAATKNGNDWIFAVKDNGIGFEEQYVDKIFQVFQRLHGVGKYPGSGIGLAICRRIIEHHGGKLWATSAPGVGSTFFFSLPLDGSHGCSHENVIRDPAGGR